MSRLLNFEERARPYKFQEQIVKLLNDKNPLYDFRCGENEAMSFLHYHQFIYIFYKYIPKGKETTLPTLEDSLKGLEENKRISIGEWVVEHIFALDKKQAIAIFPLIYKKDTSDHHLRFLKNIMIKKVKK